MERPRGDRACATQSVVCLGTGGPVWLMLGHGWSSVTGHGAGGNWELLSMMGRLPGTLPKKDNKSQRIIRMSSQMLPSLSP